MKKTLLIATALLLVSASTFAQKFCYVDMEYILGKLPQYTEAQKQLDESSKGFQKDIEAKRKTVDDMFKQYQSEQVLMTDQMKQQKMKDIWNCWERSQRPTEEKIWPWWGTIPKA